ncbi:na(+)-translocating NADH-quinone reductase subunit [Flavobacteriaceae bacterium UJ101]|nr:na(+)-translocating NADH-quinone reductase subunit [Flavobacteriaceae bacterium UJ101]
MSKDISIRKGLDIKLVGEAELTTKDLPASKVYALRPDDFHGVIPKLIAKQGHTVKAGSPLFFAKGNDKVLFPSPVSGEVIEVKRGEKRKILEIKVSADLDQVYEDFGTKDPSSMNREQVIDHLTSSGCWPFIKQRPYDIIASPDDQPKAIFVSGINSAPLAPNMDFVLAGKEEVLKAGFTALTKLTEGKVHLTIGKSSNAFPQVAGVEVHKASGKHPVGLVSTQIAKIDPINKGEKVWVIKAEDVAIIGELLLTGKYNAERLVALAGSGFNTPSYVKVKQGATVGDIVAGNIKEGNYRIISGDVLTGTLSSKENFLGYYDNQITVIPEGDDYDFFGWNKPQPNKFSVSRATLFSFLTPNKKYDLNTNTNGEHRAFVVTGEYEKVFPLDIYPMQLLKAILVKDIDEMEALGIYEVAPEDFALTEYICISKQDHQRIVRQGLDIMINEVG